MRYLSYSLFGVIFVIIAFVFGLNWFTGAPVTSTLDEDYRQVNAYALPEQSTVKFNFSSSTTTTKLLFYVLVEPEKTILTSDEKPDFRFSIEYRFDQKQAFQKIDLSTQLTNYLSLDNNQPKPAYRLPQTTLLVSDSRSLEFSIPTNGKKSLELRLVHKDPNVDSVLFRSYYTESSTMRDSQRRWARLSRSTQNRLARFHPFGPHYLSDTEIQNVLSNRNQIIAPIGISGKDFIQRPLWSYQYPDLLITDARDKIQERPNLGPDLRQSVRVSQSAPVEYTYRVPGKKSAQVAYWHRALDGKVTEGSFALLGEEGSATNTLEAGDYVFYANQIMNFELVSSEHIELSGFARRFYKVNTSSLTYSLSESLNSTQVIKLNLLAQPDVEFDINYEFRTGSGELVLSGVMNHQQSLDSFSSIKKGSHASTTATNNYHVSKLSERIIKVPKGVAKLIVSPNNNTGLVRVSNSLESLAPNVVLAGKDSLFHSNWFELQPEMAPRESSKPVDDNVMASVSLAIDQVAWVTSFERYAFSLVATPVQLQSLHSNILLPIVDLYEPIDYNNSELQSPVVYRPVELNQRFEVNIEPTIEADQTVVMRALYKGSKDAPKTLKVNIDDKPYSYDLLDSTGKISLPTMSTGKHILTLQAADNLKVYLSHLAPKVDNTEISYKKRPFSQFSSRISYGLSGPIRKDQTLQILLAYSSVPKPFSLTISATNSRETRLIRRIQVVPQKSTPIEMLNLSDDSAFSMLPPIYLPLAILSDFDPDQLEILFDNDDTHFLSTAILDGSGIQFSRAFSDTIEEN